MKQVIYIGTGRKEYDLSQNKIYTEKPVELINNLKEKFPLIGQLFVPVAKLGEATKDLTKQGTPIFLANQQVRHTN